MSNRHTPKKNPSAQELRLFGMTIFIGFGLVGLAFFRKNHSQAAVFMWALSIAMGTVALTFPKAGSLLYRAWMALGFCIGTVSNRIILIMIYYLVITPFAIIFRLMRRDFLRVRVGKYFVNSYWIDHPAVNDKDYYKHLF